MIFTQSSYQGTDQILTIRPSGDWHIGHINCRYDIIQNYLKTLNETNRGLLMGDLLECATKDSIGKGLFETNMTPAKQRDLVIQMIEPYAKYIDGCVIGNHEERIVKDTSIDLLEDICKTLKIPYHHYRGIVRYSWNEVCYLIHIWHGAGGGSTTATALKNAEALSYKTFAHVYCIGHFHKLGTSDKVYNQPSPRTKTILKIPQHFVLCGSALAMDEGYADMKALDERQLGFPIIQLNGEKKNKNVAVIIGGI